MSNAGFEMTFRSAPDGIPSDAARPLKVLIILSAEEIATTPPRRVNYETFDGLLEASTGRLQISFDFPDGRRQTTLEFNDEESFDPAHIAAQINELKQLRTLRDTLGDPAGAAEASNTLRALLGLDRLDVQPAASDAASSEPDSNDFSRLVGGSSSADRSQNPRVSRLIEAVLASEGDSATHTADAALAAAVDAVRDEVLRQVLADDCFRRVERTWRSIRWLMSSLDDEQVELWLARVPFDPAAAQQALEHVLSEASAGPDGNAFALLVLDRVASGEEDLTLLAGLGDLAGTGNAMVLASVDPVLGIEPGDSELDAAWAEFRAKPGAAHVAVALPRLLLRMPFGKRGEASDVPDFEELTSASEHEAFLWGNPAYGLALLLGQLFEREGWSMNVDGLLELDDLPMPVFDDGTGDDIKPPAERYLDEQDTARLAGKGIMAFQSYRNRNAVRLSAFHSAG